MPKYLYVCEDCNKTFEIDATIKEKEKNEKNIFLCPKCKSIDIRQKFCSASYIKNDSGNFSCPTGTCPFMT